MKNLFKRFVKEESGATMVEYAIMVALIAVVAIVAVTAIGGGVEGAFQSVADKLPTTTPPT